MAPVTHKDFSGKENKTCTKPIVIIPILLNISISTRQTVSVNENFYIHIIMKATVNRHI